MSPEAKTPEREYIETYWESLAGVAWKEFKAHGRGALLVANLDDPRGDAVYVPLQMLTANPLTAQAARMASEYDPRREIVAILINGSAVTGYQGAPAGREAPPEVYRRINSVLFERH